MWRRIRTHAGQQRGGGTTWIPDLTWLEPVSGPSAPACPVAPGGDTLDLEASLRRLARAIAEFRGEHTAPTLSATRLINPLLDLWAVASAIDHSIAAPIETLLTKLLARSVTTPAEISASLDDVESAARRLRPVAR